MLLTMSDGEQFLFRYPSFPERRWRRLMNAGPWRMWVKCATLPLDAAELLVAAGVPWVVGPC